MFLHLGTDKSILKKDVVAILNVRTHSAAATGEFLEIARDEKKLHLLTEPGKIKSYVLTVKGVYGSPISCATLKKRVESEIMELE
ncbi:MAG: DUF370 domain-containing protein [Thermoanaerobacteraceae bacterium]|nr:DUF370 domain-containing protein [Thermoanaerobacteraceae bacterium]